MHFALNWQRLAIRSATWVTMLAASLGIAFALDATMAEWATMPIRSGQTVAVIDAMRCWGDGAVLVVITAGLWLAQPRRGATMLTIAVAALLTGAIVDQLKPVSRRLRPEEAKHQTGGVDTWHHGTGRNSSFPSGHTATAFAYARALSLAYPAVQPVVYLAACGTGVSRMRDERHYLSDCVAGGWLGWIVASFCWYGFQRLEHARRAKPTTKPSRARAA